MFELRQLVRTDYRGVVALVPEWSELRRPFGLAEVPRASTLAHASRRILADAEDGGGASGRGRSAAVRRARKRRLDRPGAPVDATGLDARYVSAHFGVRRANGKDHRQRAWPKITAVAHT